MTWDYFAWLSQGCRIVRSNPNSQLEAKIWKQHVSSRLLCQIERVKSLF